MRRGFMVLAAALLLPTCERPTAPTPAADIAGEWIGTFQLRNRAGPYMGDVIVNLTQVKTSVTGTWAEDGGVNASGTISGTVGRANFSGTITFTYDCELGIDAATGNCFRSPTPTGPTYQAAFSGTATSSSLNWTTPGFAGNC